jgi:hypothetical protein
MLEILFDRDAAHLSKVLESNTSSSDTEDDYGGHRTAQVIDVQAMIFFVGQFS